MSGAAPTTRDDVYARHGHCTVAQLIAATSAVRLSDVLVTNDVGNLTVLRDGEYIGFIELSNRDLGAKPRATWEEKYEGADA